MSRRFLEMDLKLFDEAVVKIFGRKGEDIVKLNIDALKSGYDYSLNASTG